MLSNKTVSIYTDGSCNVKTKFGGIGIFIQFGERIKTLQQGYSDTTVSRMELRAIITAMQALKSKDKYLFKFYSDSEYTINSINKGWLLTWEKEGFINRKNADLWKLFLTEYRQFKNITFTHVRGHQGIAGNEAADRLADYKQFKEYVRDNN